MGQRVGCRDVAGPPFRFPAHQWERDSPTSCERQQTQAATLFLWCAFELLINILISKNCSKPLSNAVRLKCLFNCLISSRRPRRVIQKMAAGLSCNAIGIHCWRFGLTGERPLNFPHCSRLGTHRCDGVSFWIDYRRWFCPPYLWFCVQRRDSCLCWRHWISHRFHHADWLVNGLLSLVRKSGCIVVSSTYWQLDQVAYRYLL